MILRNFATLSQAYALGHIFNAYLVFDKMLNLL